MVRDEQPEFSDGYLCPPYMGNDNTFRTVADSLGGFGNQRQGDGICHISGVRVVREDCCRSANAFIESTVVAHTRPL